MTKNIVIGASGLIGSHLAKLLTSEGNSTVATYHNHPVSGAIHLDMRESINVEKLFQDSRPRTVFLPAANPNVEYCETNPADTYENNVRGVENIVKAANNIDARVIYFSSDYIFDGKAGPYDEIDIPNPINEYGRQKLVAERLISFHANDYLIIRTTIVYGWEQQEKNFIYRLIDTAKLGNRLKVPTDQIGTPTYANELAENAIHLSKTHLKGVINLSGPVCISRYNFALEAAQVFNLPMEFITPVTTKELNQTARRPLLAGLKINQAKSLLKSVFLSPREGLQKMRDEMPAS